MDNIPEDVRERRDMWSRLLSGIVSEMAKDGCDGVTEKEIAAFGVLVHHAKSDIARHEAERSARMALNVGGDGI